MVEIIWKEPPPAVNSEKAAILAELQKHPGRWALLGKDKSSSAAADPWKKLGCEATYRRTNPGEKKPKYDVYGRWPEAKSRDGMASASRVAERVVAPAGTQPQPPRPSSGGTYDPGLGRAARGVPPEGLHPASLRR